VYGNFSVYATDIRPAGDGTSQRLSVNQPKTLYRGSFSGYSNWTSMGSDLGATLNVSGLATNNLGREDTASIVIQLGRCYSGSGYNIGWNGVDNGTCYYDPVTVNIRRAARPIVWTITPTVSITSPASEVMPGDKITWKHTIKNNGPHTTNKTITFRGQNQGYLGTSNAVSSTATNMANQATKSINSSSRTISPSDAGNIFCRRTIVAPQSSTNGSTLASAQACRTIPYKYSLIPSITNLSDRDVIESDKGTVPVIGRVTNEGPTKSRPNAAWQLTQVSFKPNVNPNAAQLNGGTGATPCTYITGEASCTPIGQGTEASGYTYNANKTYSHDGVLNNEEPGTKICFIMSVQPYAHDVNGANAWRHSKLYCLVVGKSPKVQVWGGDISVGRVFTGTTARTQSSIQTSLTVKRDSGVPGANVFGSWGEYGVLAPSAINLTASASGLSGGASDSAQSRWSSYTFTKLSSTSYGGYIPKNVQLPNPLSIFPTTAAVTETNWNLSTMAKGRNVKPASGVTSITLGSNGDPTLKSGEWLVINAAGKNVVIDKNLTYANGSYSNARDIPQLIIIADNITINHGVTAVDAWLVAKNAISTCEEQGNASTLSSSTNYAGQGARLDITKCKEPLRINGPIIANKLYLRRTAGSNAGPAAGDPAEVISIRPDAYMWANVWMRSVNIYRTTNLSELPPRY
jgi:hypothetical protein